MMKLWPCIWKLCCWQMLRITTSMAGILKLDHLVAALAVEMFVLRVAIIVLVKHAWADFQPRSRPASTSLLSVR